MKIKCSWIWWSIQWQRYSKKGETWDTDKNNAVDLINKGWAEAIKSAPKKTAQLKLKRKKLMPSTIWAKRKEI